MKLGPGSFLHAVLRVTAGEAASREGSGREDQESQDNFVLTPRGLPVCELLLDGTSQWRRLCL